MRPRRGGGQGARSNPLAPTHKIKGLDENLSLSMTVFLKSLIDRIDGDNAEALPEFLQAIELKKLRLKREDFNDFAGYSMKKLHTGSMAYDFIEYQKGKP